MARKIDVETREQQLTKLLITGKSTRLLFSARTDKTIFDPSKRHVKITLVFDKQGRITFGALLRRGGVIWFRNRYGGLG